MRVTIIPGENLVLVEGVPETVDCSSLSNDIHATQWFGATGEVEFVNFPGETFKANERISDFTGFQAVVDLWEVEAKKSASISNPK